MNHLLLFDKNTKLSKKAEILAVLSLAWPAIIEQVMITMVQYIDTAMVGSQGSNATAAIGITVSPIWLFTGILGAAGVGFSVQVAQYVGAGRYEEVKEVVRQSLLFNLFFGIFVGGVAVAISWQLPHWLGADPAIAADASSYFRIVGLSMPFLLASELFSSIIRCMGDTKTPMFLNIMINVLNIGLNFIFIYPTRTVSLFGFSFGIWGLGLGVTGAAIASAIAAGVVGIVMIAVLFLKKTPMQIFWKEGFHFHMKYYRQMLKIGVPVLLERSTLCIAQIVITTIIAKLGTIAVAANYLALTAETMSYLPANGIAIAATTLVGQAIGAKRQDLAVKFARISTWMGVVMMTCTGLLLYFFPRVLVGMFTSDAAVITLGAQVLQIEAFAQPLFAIAIVASGALRGAGDTKWSFYINLISMWGVRITIAAIFASRIGLAGVWIAMCTELCVRGLILLARLYSNRWLKVGKIS